MWCGSLVLAPPYCTGALEGCQDYTEVATALRITRHTVVRWETWFERDGIKGLGGPPRY